MNDFSKDFFLLEIEAHGNLGVLQIIVAAARVRLISEESRRGDKIASSVASAKNGALLPLVSYVAKEFPDHSALLL